VFTLSSEDIYVNIISLYYTASTDVFILLVYTI